LSLPEVDFYKMLENRQSADKSQADASKENYYRLALLNQGSG
jgi:hypothetical protein